MSPSKTGELLILCDKYASAAAVAAAASGCAATVAFDQRGRSFGPSVTVVRELPDDPSAWASSFPRAVFAAPSLGSLRSLASMDCSEGVFELAFVLLGLGVCVELPPLSANPLARGFAPALAAEAGRLLAEAAALGFSLSAAAPVNNHCPGSPRLVSAEYAATLDKGSVLELEARSIVTPSAFDVLRERGVRITRPRRKT